MTKRLFVLPLVVLLYTFSALAQSSVTGVGSSSTPFAGVPSGSCSSTQNAVNTLTGDYYSCNGSAWLKVGPGAAGAAAFNTITTGVNASATMTIGTGAFLLTSGSGTIAATAVPWSGFTVPAGNLSLAMGANTSIFSTTTAQAGMFAWKNTTAAVVGTSQGSPFLNLCGRAWHGGADVEDCLTLNTLPGNGLDAAITFTVGHTGTSTGLVTTAFPGPVQAGTSGGVGGTLSLPEGTAVSGIASSDLLYADSTLHRVKMLNNAGTADQVMGAIDDQNQSATYKVDTGAADAYVVTLTPAVTAYVTGQRFSFKAVNANATTTPTVNINGLGAKTIVKNNNAAMAANDIKAGQLVDVEYDGTNFQMQSTLGNAAAAGSGVTLTPANTAANTIAPTTNSTVGLTVVETTGTGSPDIADFCNTGACATSSSVKISSIGGLTAPSLVSGASITVDSIGTGNRSLYFSALGDKLASTSTANGDLAGSIAISAATSASFTFTTAYTNTPSCTVSPTSDPTATGVWWTTISTTVLTVNIKTSGTITFNYHCIAMGS